MNHTQICPDKLLQESSTMLEELAGRRDDVDPTLIDQEKIAEAMAEAVRNQEGDGTPKTNGNGSGNLAGMSSNGNGSAPTRVRGRGGWLEVKRIKGNPYLYYRWREGKKVRSRYIGKASAAA